LSSLPLRMGSPGSPAPDSHPNMLTPRSRTASSAAIDGTILRAQFTLTFYMDCPRIPWAVRPRVYFETTYGAGGASFIFAASFFIAALTAAADTPSPRASADWCG
jgi:hypothetical protein